MGAFWHPRHSRVRSDETSECGECGRRVFDGLGSRTHDGSELWTDTTFAFEGHDLCVPCAIEAGELESAQCVFCVEPTDGDGLVAGLAVCAKHDPLRV